MLNRDRKFILACVILALVLFASALIALCMGQYSISPKLVFAVLTGHGPAAEGANRNLYTVLYRIRIPRVLLSMLAGAGLATAGAAFQSLFSNPLATPDTLGVANGASFGAALAILMGLSAAGIQLTALAFGVLAVGLVFAVTGSGVASGKKPMIMVILAGMVVSSLFSAMVSLIKYVADPQDVLPVITFWLMGSFSGVTQRTLTLSAPFITGGIVLLFLLRFRLNALSLPEDEAKSLGLNLKLIRALVILASTACTAAVVASCGLIGWVGLLIPHISRMAFGNNNARVIPFSILTGALFMLITDTVARCATGSEIPVSILTAVIGAPVFILLLRKTGGFLT